MELVANVVSLTIFLPIVIPILMYIEHADPFYLELPAGIFAAVAGVELFKRVVGSAGFLGRPVGARDCDLFCIGGPAAGKPGFPSGHMTSVTMFVTAMWRRGQNEWVLWIGIPWILVMAWARWAQRCHSPLQIIAGVLFGFLMATLITPWAGPTESAPDHVPTEQH